jgi:hypothetical protein
MCRHRAVGALVLSTVLLTGLGTGAAHAETFWHWVQRQHAKHVAFIEREHAKHVRALRRLDAHLWAAHERHLEAAPVPLQRVDRFVDERHQAHLRFLSGVDRGAQRDVGAVDRSAQRGATAIDRAAHGDSGLLAEQPTGNLTTLEERHAEHEQAVASVGASAEPRHGHRSPLQRLADWIEGT